MTAHTALGLRVTGPVLITQVKSRSPPVTELLRRDYWWSTGRAQSARSDRSRPPGGSPLAWRPARVCRRSGRLGGLRAARGPRPGYRPSPPSAGTTLSRRPHWRPTRYGRSGKPPRPAGRAGLPGRRSGSHANGRAEGPLVSQCTQGTASRRAARRVVPPLRRAVSRRPRRAGRGPLRGWLNQHGFASHRTGIQQPPASAPKASPFRPGAGRRRSMADQHTKHESVGLAETGERLVPNGTRSTSGATAGCYPNLAGPSAGSLAGAGDAISSRGARRWGRV